MRIGINCSILSGHLTGIGTYVTHLVDALARLENGNEWVLLGVDAGFAALPVADNVRVVPARGLQGWRRIAWEQQTLPSLVKSEGLDLLHCPDFSLPLFGPGLSVNTLHDLSYYVGGFFSLPKAAYKRTLTRVSTSRSRSLIAVSKFTSDQLLEKFPLDPRSVTVIYSGVEVPFVTPTKRPDRPFVLYVGTLETRKNLKSLVNAFTELKRAQDLPHTLVLAGQHGRGWQEVASAIQDSPVRDEIEMLGYVSRPDVYRLYRSADLLVYPSLYEGFGLPVVEAMACGLPVICSNTTGLPEAGGDAAVYFDPRNTDELKRAIDRVLSSGDLQAEMRRKGLKHAAHFSWEKCAREHHELYQRTVQS
jgi:glycosyltransferase involved in cell wall biosynthesis